MKFKINRNNIIAFGYLLMIASELFSSTVFNYALSLIYTDRFIVCFIGFAFVLFGTVFNPSAHMYKNDIFSLVLLLSFFVVCINNSNFANIRFTYEIIYFSNILISVYTFKKNKEINTNLVKIVINNICLFGFLASIATILCYCVPGLYKKMFLKMGISSPYYDSLRYCFENNFMPGFAVHYSTNAGFIIPIFGYSFVTANFKKNKKIKYIIIFIITALALLLTGKRAHLMFGAVALFITYYVKEQKNKKNRLIKFFLVTILILIAFNVLSIYYEPLRNFLSRFNEVSDDKALLERFSMYNSALTLIKNNFIIGIGWGGFKYTLQNSTGIFNDAHNVYIQLLTETGILGFLIFLILFITMLTYNLKNSKTVLASSYSVEDKKITYFALFYYVYFLFYCLTGNPLYDIYIWSPLIIIFICSNNIVRIKEKQIKILN